MQPVAIALMFGSACAFDSTAEPAKAAAARVDAARILAVRPETGKLVWHYQTTPGESWDYTATQHMILADLTIGGKPRKLLLQAPKNGFF